MSYVSYGLNVPSEIMLKSNCYCDIKNEIPSWVLRTLASWMKLWWWERVCGHKRASHPPERLGPSSFLTPCAGQRPSSGASTVLLDFTVFATIICINVYGLQWPSLWQYVMATEKAIEQYFLGRMCLLWISIPFGTSLCSQESLQVSQVYRSKCTHHWSFLPWFPSMSFKVCLVLSRL